MSPIGEKIAPITSRIGFLNASIEKSTEAFLSWRRTLKVAQIVDNALPGGLFENAHRLEPLVQAVRPRELLVGTSDPAWTAVFDCSFRLGSQGTTIGVLTQALSCAGVVVTHVPDSPSRQGGTQFELFGPSATDPLGIVRGISVTRDDSRWSFDAVGAVQDFEDIAAYSKRRVKDRFTYDMLVRYCRSLGLDAFDDDFYPGPSALMTTVVKIPTGARIMSLPEAQRLLKIDA